MTYRRADRAERTLNADIASHRAVPSLNRPNLGNLISITITARLFNYLVGAGDCWGHERAGVASIGEPGGAVPIVPVIVLLGSKLLEVAV